MADSPQVPMTEQFLCVQREITMRERVYPRWIEAGRMTAKKAEHEIRSMKAVLVTLEKLQISERLI